MIYSMWYTMYGVAAYHAAVEELQANLMET